MSKSEYIKIHIFCGMEGKQGVRVKERGGWRTSMNRE